MTTLRGHTLPNVPPLPERRSGADRYDRVSRNVLSIVVVCLALGTAVATAILDSPLPMLLLLVAALVVLHRELAGTHWRDVLVTFRALPSQTLAVAAGLGTSALEAIGIAGPSIAEARFPFKPAG